MTDDVEEWHKKNAAANKFWSELLGCLKSAAGEYRDRDAVDRQPGVDKPDRVGKPDGVDRFDVKDQSDPIEVVSNEIAFDMPTIGTLKAKIVRNQQENSFDWQVLDGANVVPKESYHFSRREDSEIVAIHEGAAVEKSPKQISCDVIRALEARRRLPRAGVE